MVGPTKRGSMVLFLLPDVLFGLPPSRLGELGTRAIKGLSSAIRGTCESHLNRKRGGEKCALTFVLAVLFSLDSVFKEADSS